MWALAHVLMRRQFQSMCVYNSVQVARITHESYRPDAGTVRAYYVSTRVITTPPASP
jgi:hypothetical protein